MTRILNPSSGGINGVEFCALRLSSDQTIGNAASQSVTWDTEISDTGDWHSTSTNTSRITVPGQGIYLIVSSIQFVANGTGGRGATFAVDGTAVYGRAFHVAAGSSFTHGESASVVLSLTAGQYVEAQVYQSSGGDLAIRSGTGAISSYFSVTKLTT